MKKDIRSVEYLTNDTGQNLGLHETITEPIKILRPLAQIGLIHVDIFQKAIDFVNSWRKQDKFIADDLHKCNRKAWIWPNYQAKELSRSLHQSGRNSDVGVKVSFKTTLNLSFAGRMPSSIFHRVSLVPCAGLLSL